MHIIHHADCLFLQREHYSRTLPSDAVLHVYVSYGGRAEVQKHALSRGAAETPSIPEPAMIPSMQTRGIKVATYSLGSRSSHMGVT